VHGFYGNVVYVPLRREGTRREPISFFRAGVHRGFGVSKPCATHTREGSRWFRRCWQAAQAKGLTTVAIGKFGAAFIQDYKRGGIILDEDAAIPLGFAKELQQTGYPLPRNSGNAYEAGALTLANDNGDPTAPIPFSDSRMGQTGNPLDCSGALSRAASLT